MTPKQADKIIKQGSPVTIQDKYGDTGTFKFVRRDRHAIYAEDGAVFDRDDINILLK